MKLPLPEKIPVSEICRGMGLPSHAEPDEAHIPAASSISNIPSPSMNSKDLLTLLSSLCVGWPLSLE